MLAAGKFPSSPAALGEPYQSCFDKTADVVLSLAYSFYLRRKNRSFRALALNGILSWLTLGVMALFFPGSFILHGAASGRPAAMSPVLKDEHRRTPRTKTTSWAWIFYAPARRTRHSSPSRTRCGWHPKGQLPSAP